MLINLNVKDNVFFNLYPCDYFDRFEVVECWFVIKILLSSQSRRGGELEGLAAKKT